MGSLLGAHVSIAQPSMPRPAKQTLLRPLTVDGPGNASCRAASIVARNATFVCTETGEVCGDRGCNDESRLAGSLFAHVRRICFQTGQHVEAGP
jgi:hypothetical protein